jgi:tRNA G46 methylase TrmB
MGHIETKALLTRGFNGNTPDLLARADEAYCDFVSDARNILMHARFQTIGQLGEAALDVAAKATGQRPNSPEAIKDVAMKVPEVASYFRIKRTLQESYWRRIEDSFAAKGKDFEQALTDAEKMGPGSVKWDPNFVYPAYATVDIHIQPGGYTGRTLGPLTYDYGTKIFFGGAGDADTLHHSMAERTSTPKDGVVKRVMEIGCSIGQMACGLKKQHPNAEVWGTDISATMVRYAHWRTIQQGLDVNYAQMPAEDLDFPDNHFDIITAHLLFHEIPVPVIKRVLAEAKRVLRPGGVFVLWDFFSAKNRSTAANFMGLMDACDNGEPYAPGFVNCDVEVLMEQAGFTLRSHDPSELGRTGRVGDKPA